MLATLANHLWQSTVFAAAAALLAFSLRRYRAHTRHWIWLISSLKFLVPFSILTNLGSLLPAGRTVPSPRVAAAVEEFSRPFTSATIPLGLPAPVRPAESILPGVLLAVWLCGFMVVLCAWILRWRRIHVALRAAKRVAIEAPIPVVSSHTLLEPGVFGIFRPVLLLPEGIWTRLAPAQFSAILAHEFCHVRRRDNLASAIHMLVEALFWFHPLVWWIGSRMVAERERACDEEVLRLGSEPEVYAEGILNVCKFYLQSPIACVSGITGAGLKQRIETIMVNRIAPVLTLQRRIAIYCLAAVAVAGPLFIGMMRAQTQAKLEFEAASIKPNKSAATRIMIQKGQGFLGTNVTLRNLLMFAYEIKPNGLSGAPGWIDSEHFDVAAKAPPGVTDEERRRMMQSLLAERFKLVVHREAKEMPVYALVLAKNGPRLQLAKTNETNFRGSWGLYDCQAVPVSMLAGQLGKTLGRSVTDETGLKGQYDFKLEWTPDEPPRGPEPLARSVPDQTGPSIFTALQEQLGLKLESRKGQVEVLIIDSVEKVPTEN